ncbi:MAG: hypothetical protein ABH836_02175 [Candidatus Omnitrophota bacterium]
MSLEERWEKALNKTEIIKARMTNLLTFEPTALSYIFLAESAVNPGDTVVRKGEVIVEKPMLVLPDNFPQFEGFDFKKELKTNDDSIRTLLLMRGISFPSLKYHNVTSAIDIYEGGLSKAIKEHKRSLQEKEDLTTGLIVGPEDCWQLSILLYMATMASKSAASDIKKLLDKFKKNMGQ